MREGWEYKKLGDICTIERGGSPRPIKKFITDDSNGLNWIKIGDTDPQGKYIFSTTEKIIPEGLKKSRWVAENDFLLSNSMSFGRPYILKTNGCIHDGWLVLRNYQKSLYIDFFYYLLISPRVQNQFKNKAQGSTVSNLNTQRVSDVIVGYPSISEQQEIVDYLDASFAKIDAMKANAEKALEEGKALFQSALKQMLEPKEGWEEKTLKECSVIAGNYGLSVPSTTFNGVRYLRITDITDWGDLNDDKVSTKLDEDKEQDKLEEGDLLFARTGATVGKTLMYKNEFGDCLFAGYLIRYRLNKGIVLPKYVFYITHSDKYYKWILENQKAAAQPNISAKLYNEYLLSYPSINEQQTIVTTLDSIKSKVDRLQENYDNIAKECDTLKQAILRQVFE